MYPIDKYKFYTDDAVNPSRVYAVSSYAGKTVRGTARCDSRDTFSMEKGKELAAARCEEKVAKKRMQRALKKYNEACDAQEKAAVYTDHMAKYLKDSLDGLTEATIQTQNLLKDM